MEQAGIRRLAEEMGIVDIQALSDVANFVYRAKLDNGLVEHELDHVLVASAPEVMVVPNPEEVLTYRWWPQSELQTALAQEPECFTAWFPQVLELALANA